MTALFTLFRLRSLLILASILCVFSPLSAQNEVQTNASTEDISKSRKPKETQKDARKAALEAQKNAIDLRKITLLLAIAQDRDRQAAESMEDIRSRRLRIEEDLTDADDNPKHLSKKERSDLETQLKALQKKEILAQKTRESANDFLIDVTEAVAAEPSKRAKFIGTYERKSGPINDSKPIEPLPSESLASSEKEQSKLVAVSEKTKTMAETTPSVQTPVFSENMPEMMPNIAISTSKKKKEPNVKQNQSPKKVDEKEAKKKSKTAKIPAEEKKPTEDFPLVLTETPPPTATVEEVVVEQKKADKKTSKKEPKKKVKKADKPTDTAAKTEEFPIVSTEPTTPITTPPTDKIVENTPTTPSEKVATNDSVTEEKGVKTDKKQTKNDKKTKKRATTEATQGSLVSYRTYERGADAFMNSPAPECAIAYEGKDEFTGKTKRETYPTRFFAHTDDIMKKALMEKDFITCDLTGTKVENSRYTYLNMTFTILSKDIQRTLGFLDRGTPIIFVMVNGNKITLKTNKTDIGVVDIDKGTTTYKAQLTAESITDLTDSEIDYVRVIWSSGYEDYEVYDVDILKNLFNCLYKK
jgi:hypothetical protein